MHTPKSSEHQRLKLQNTFNLIERKLIQYIDGEIAVIAGGFVRDTYFLDDPSKVNDVDIFINDVYAEVSIVNTLNLMKFRAEKPFWPPRS